MHFILVLFPMSVVPMVEFKVTLRCEGWKRTVILLMRFGKFDFKQVNYHSVLTLCESIIPAHEKC